MNKLAIVTSADKAYIPGVRALYNSLVKNSNINFELFLLAHGNEDDFLELKDFPIQCIYNKETVASPTSKDWPITLPAMYSRLLIPELFKEYERVLWLDADIIILKDISELLSLDISAVPCAGALPGTPGSPRLDFMPFQFEVPPKNIQEYTDINSIQAGVLLFNPKEWLRLNLDTKIKELLLSNIKFKFVVQGYLGYLLKGNFKILDKVWNCYANWVVSNSINLADVKILHYVGGKDKVPWKCTMPLQTIWETYK